MLKYITVLVSIAVEQITAPSGCSSTKLLHKAHGPCGSGGGAPCGHAPCSGPKVAVGVLAGPTSHLGAWLLHLGSRQN